ncbi:MAG: T9SS type A sorting domain-containing protein [Crocinitomicaceae bacterium]|nr:T9SS type A sorting domain-containing protein [Crocinitomicaceae bacterium]
MKTLNTILATLLFSCISFSQNFTEIIKSVANDRAAGDQYGYAVDIDGDYAVIGAYSDNFGGSENHGSVYVYKQNGINDWDFHQKIISNDQEDYDRFGWSVAIDGDYIIVGAYREDEDASELNSLSSAGSAYIFEKDVSGNFVQVEKLVASDRAVDDEFGWSVAISGTTAIVGARAEDHNVAGAAYMYSAGSAYIFNRDVSGNWIQSQKICAADRSTDINYPGGYSGEDLGDQFGWAVSISGDYLIVGALHHDYGPAGPPTAPLWSSGAAYIFERTAGVWNQVQKIQNFDRESWDRFGCAVDIDTNVLIVGAYSEDEVEDGVSDELTNPGSAYLYERNGSGTWVFTQKIVPDDRNSGDHFGYSFALEDTLLVIGTHSDDHDEFGGNLADDAGSAYIFEKNAGVWSELQKIDASDRITLDEFGISVGLSDHTIIIGSFLQDFDATGSNEMIDAGAAYFFSNQTCPILITNQSVDLCFGESITVGSNTYSADGSYSDLLVSVQGCDSTVNTTLTIAPEISSSNNTSVCFGSGEWIGGIYYTTSGSYPVVFTAMNGCDSIAYTNLTVENEITASQNVSICYGESFTIGVNTYTVSGVYTDIVTATNFCDSVITTNLTVQLPINSAINQSNNTLTAIASGANYQWINCTTQAPIAGATGQIFTAPLTGSYAVIVTENGCSDPSACVYVDVVIVGFSESDLDGVVIYPNPNNGNFVIRFDAEKFADASFILVNSLGDEIALIKETNTIKPEEKLAAGIYLLQISTPQGIVTRKIVVQ